MSRITDILGDWLFVAEALLAVFAAVVFLVFWMRARRIMRKRADQTDSPWDNIVINVIDLPLITVVIVLGLQHSVLAVANHFSQLSGVREFSSHLRALVLVVGAFWLLMRLISELERVFRRRVVRIGDQHLEPGVLHSGFRVLRFFVFIIAGLTALDALGVSISGILTFGGVGGIIIGFAAKDTLANFISGLMIFWERPFVVGDWIRCPTLNAEGTVERIGWRMTQIRTFDHRPLYIPNSLFSDGIIENPQRMTNRRIYEYFGVRYADIGKMRAVLSDIRQMLAEHEGIDGEQICMVNLDKYGASSVDFFIYAMTTTTKWEKFHEVKEDILLRVADIVEKNGAEFAFPSRSLYHISYPARKGEESNATPPPPPA